MNTTALPEVALIWLSYVVSLAAVGSWIIAGWRKASQRSAVRNFFGAKSVTVVLPLRLLHGRRAVDEADFTAAVQLARFLENARLVTNFRFVEPDGSLDLEADGLVAICGPKSSPVIGRAIAADPRIAFASVTGSGGHRWMLTDLADGLAYESPMDNGIPDGDVAYLARLPRRPGSRATMLVIAGIHAAGSAGVVHLLTNRTNLRSIAKQTRGRCFSAIVSSDFQHDPFRVLESHLDHLAVDT